MLAGLLGASGAGLGCETKPKGAPPASVGAAPGTTEDAGPAGASTALPAFKPEQLHLFAPIPEGVDSPALDEVVKLGRRLYFERRISSGKDVSCSSCHDLGRAGTDGEVTATGTKQERAKRNTPTVLNAGGSFAQGWDARATTIEDFVLPHMLAPAIMGMADEKHVVQALGSIPGYAASFRKAFPEERPAVSGDTVGRALGAFTKRLFARSRWDRYLAGDKGALSETELGGVAMFVEAGCSSCHQGKYLGATQAQKLGIAAPWPAPAGTDPGRFEVTGQEVDRGMWKVPTLRNVTRTAPYLHDGSVPTIEEITRRMARHQVGRELTDPQIAAIVAFLRTLEGDAPGVLTGADAGAPEAPKPTKAD